MDFDMKIGALSGNPAEDVKKLHNEVFQLQERLRYLFRNLDVTNFNDLGLARYENGRLQIYTEQVRIAATELEAQFKDSQQQFETTIKATVNGLETTVKENSATLGTMQSQVTQSSNQISAIVSAVGSGGTVTAASIVAAINSSGSSVMISADKVNVSGFVTFTDLASSGATTINGDNITSGEIRAVNFVASGDVSGSRSTSFVVDDGMGNVIGGIGYTYQSRDGYYGDKLYLYTQGYGGYQPAIKLEAAGGISIEAYGSGRPVYIYSASGTVSLNGNKIYIKDNNGTEWEFKDGGLYKNEIQVL